MIPEPEMIIDALVALRATTNDSSGMEWLPALLAAIAAAASAASAFLLYRNQKGWNNSDAFLRITERLESKEMRDIRNHYVYAVHRDDAAEWEEEQRIAIDTWGAELERCATVILAEQVDMAAFFRIYGDVLLRSIYQLAPYANAQRVQRGSQFWLPMSDLAAKVITTWKRQVLFGMYPAEIGIPHHPGIRLTPDVFARDGATRTFLEVSQSGAVLHKRIGRRLRVLGRLFLWPSKQLFQLARRPTTAARRLRKKDP